MQIILNNRPAHFEGEKITVNELIKRKNFTFKLLVTKINGKLVRVDERDNAWIMEGDKVEVMHLISGG
ncbi:MAG TPA: sulfur carrier protein ThiS [Bacteroidales bacterium]|jgi:thiamine biosynthesis protein ThiS|nr:sulfur carrier protein ThiS [Bacteroidales bacterium]MDD4086647.1 sulfur carrier protein ThiS [Bacteroidales bacterium]MDY0085607.1 sulfur carrier protein ThiS [Bacteroidales bacterium]HPE43220.1 sulfur carrier protein ThiS [Bacteroidales bacterium]